jgi:cation diffusion facilitator family transporter
VFLIATRIAVRNPNREFPYGYHRATSIAFLCASLALLTMGAWLLVDALVKLVNLERPTIGGINVFGQTIWLGWLMIAALLYSVIPVIFLGWAKLPLANKLHDKVLHVDAQMNKADWMTGTAAIVGVLGIGLGYWWADSVAAALISLDILYDGYKNLTQVISDLMDRVPRTVDGSRHDPLPDRVRDRLQQFPWVRQAQVRMREEGHVYFGEAFLLVDEHEPGLPAKLAEAAKACRELHWRVHELVITPVLSLQDSGAAKTNE